MSNEVLFNLPFLAKYQEFIGNRVLTIDDFSDQFNGVQRGFELFTDNNPIFEIEFDGSDIATLVLVKAQLMSPITILSVVNLLSTFHQATISKFIQIQETDFGVGIGTTTLLPSQFYVIKQDNRRLELQLLQLMHFCLIPLVLD